MYFCEEPHSASFENACSGESTTDILNELDLSLLDEYLLEIQETSTHLPNGFHIPGSFPDADIIPLSLDNWTPKHVSFSSDAFASQGLFERERERERDAPFSFAVDSPELFPSEPAASPQDHFVAEAPAGAEATAVPNVPRRGKPRVYEWPPQSDPEKEKKRQRAIKAYTNRQRIFQREQETQNRLNSMKKLALQLQSEKQELERELLHLESLIRERER